MPALRPVSARSGPPRLRPVRPDDWRALNALHSWAWFPERSEAGWRWLLGMSGPCPGWVLEDADGVCGFLGNLVQTYVRDGLPARAATGYSLIVLPRARGGSRQLLDAFQAQPDVFAVSILNGNRRSAAIYRREGLAAFPPGWADVKIVWPLRPFTIAAERVAWKVAGPRRPDRELFNLDPCPRRIHLGDPRIVALHPATDGPLLDRYWAALAARGGVLADRSAATLMNRFGDPDRTGDPVLLGWREGERLTATALAQLGKMSPLESPILDLIDLTWLEPGSRAGPVALVARMKEVALDLGASRLRLPLATPALAAVARQVRGALIRRHHVHAHARLHAPEVATGWAVTPYDGDCGFSLRPKPPGRPAGHWRPPGPRTAREGREADGRRPTADG